MFYLYPKDDNTDKSIRKSKSISVHVTKEYGEVELWLHSLLNTGIGGRESCDSYVYFTPRERALRNHQIEGWIGSRDGLYDRRRQNSQCSARNRTPDRVFRSLVTTTTTSPPHQKIKIQEKLVSP